MLALLLIQSFTILSVHESSESLDIHHTQRSSGANVISNLHQETRSTDYSITPAKSIIRVHKGQNQTASVILSCQTNLRYMSIGLSTIVKPSYEIERKIDANLLNLTELVTKEYLHNNQTNVIISISNKDFLEQSTDWTAQKNLFETISRLYTSTLAYDDMHFLAARLNYSRIFDLARNSYVDHIWLDRRFTVYLDQSVDIIRNPVEWANFESSFGRNVNGSGVKIAILDTGIDPTHPDFYFPNGTSSITNAISFTGESTADKFGHGTHCASIAAGTGAANNGQYVGVAPGATLLNVKVLNNQGEGMESWIISGIQWAVDNNAEILSMSFGGSISSDGTDPMSTTVNWATEQGVVCVVAAGNCGPEMYSITSPGVAESAITVGASHKNDAIASFSSRGPTTSFTIKPDILAPGVDIIAARANGTNMGTPVSQFYTMASGTSMATPHATGAAALLVDAYPSWNPTQVKMALTNYAEDTGSNMLKQGSGRLNVCKSANASIVGNSSISFGRVELNMMYKQVVTFQNLANQTHYVDLNAEAWHIGDGIPYQTMSLNTSNFHLSFGGTTGIEVYLNTSVSLPNGYFEGRITATFDGVTIRIPLLFCIMAQLNVEVTHEDGSKLMAVFSLIDSETNEMKAYHTESDTAKFIIESPGEYIIQAINDYAWNPSGNLDDGISFIIHDKFSISAAETKYLQLSLASAYKLDVRSTDTTGSPLHFKMKQLLTPYYQVAYFSEIGVLPSQWLYLTNISDYMVGTCYFGFTALSQEDVNWEEEGVLNSEIDMYFIGWNISNFGCSPVPAVLDYEDSELATFDVQNMLPKASAISTMWFNQIAGIWQSGLWCGYQTHPGINWKIHIKPYNYENPSTASWNDLEWSCIYTLSTYPYESDEYFVIDRHFQPISRGETSVYHMGKSPLLPQSVHDNTSYYGSGLYIPYYPLLIDENLFLAKTDMQATKRIEVLKNDFLIYNETKLWAQEPIMISQFLDSYGYGLYSFIVKTETSLNYSSQNVAKYIINYTSSSTDLIPPSITKMDCPSCFTGNEYHIEIQLADNDEICNASLLYSLDDNPWIPCTLINLGEDLHSADITLSSTVQKISLIVEAVDGNGNRIVFTTKPVALKGYETQINASLNANRISGKLTIVEGVLIQPIYLKVKSGGTTMYTLTDTEGNFGFNISPSMSFPIEIEMVSTGTYGGAKCVINKPQVHNVSIDLVVPSKTVTSSKVCINATVMNHGDYTETLNVTFYANTTIINTLQDITLTNGHSITVPYEWNATNLPNGNYTISAYAWPVPGETDTTDNTFVYGIVTVTIPGDVDGDFDVDIYDVVQITGVYLSEIGDPQYKANSDLDCNGKIQIYDVIICTGHYGQKYP